MHFVVAALELSDKLQTVGALAGFAAIIGLAVLSVLYFGQAREVKRLREWAGRAPERAAEMQDRVTSVAGKRVVAQPQAQPPAEPVRPPAAQPATPGAAAAAAGVAAPASAAAAGTATASPSTASPSGPATESTDQPTALQPAVPPRPAGAPPSAPAAPAAPPSGPAPSGTTPPPAKPPVPAASPAGASRPDPVTGPETAVPLRSGRSVRDAMTQPASASASHSPAGATIAIVGAVAAIIVAILLVVTGVIGGGGGGDDTTAQTNQIVPTATTGTSTGGTSSTSTTSKTTAVDPATVSVVVLNGTGTPNLARNAADTLVKDGFTNAGAGNRGDATVPKTLVMYAPGGKPAAQAVAKAFGVSGVTPLDAGTQVVARNFAKDGKTPLVVVTLGADKATP